jgi:hypothetical protein
MNRFMALAALATLAVSSIANADEAEIQVLQKQCAIARG